MKRRLLSAFLAVMMVLTMAPVAFAADEGDTAPQSSVSLPANNTGDFTISEEGAVLDGTGVTYTDGTITVNAANVTIENLTFGDKAKLIVNTSGKFTLTGCTFTPETVCDKATKLPVRTAVTLNVGEAEVTNNTFGGTTNGYYNAIEFGIGASNNDLSKAVISGNTFNSAIRNNYFSFYNMTANAQIDIVNNKLLLAEKSSNGIRISNFRNVTGVTFNVEDDEYTYAADSADDVYEGLILLEDFSKDSAVQNFSGITINVTKLSAPKSAKRLLYVYDDQDGIITTNQPKLTGDDSLAQFYAAKVGDTYYKTLADAYAALPRNTGTDSEPTTITVLKDSEGKAIGSDSDKGMNYVIDFGGHTYTVGKPAVGSTGTETQGLRVLKGSKAVFKNGTLKAVNYPDMKMPVHTYGDVTFEDFTVDATEDSYAQIAYEIDNGSLNMIGNSSILAYPGKIGLYVSFWPRGGYTDGTTVNIDTTGKITGKMVYEWDDKADTAEQQKENKAVLNIKNGNFDITNIQTLFTSSLPSNLKVPKIYISGGYFNVDPSNYCVTGKTGVASDKDGYKYKVGTVEVKDENVIKTDTKAGATTATLGSEIATENENAAKTVGKSVTPTKLADTTPITPDDKAQALTELVKNNKVELDTNGKIPNDTTVTVVKETYLDVTVTAYDTTNHTVSMDITPKYNLIAVAKTGTDEKKVTLKSAQNAKVGSTEVQVTLPDAFKGKKVYINHNNGANLYVATADEDGKITFTTNGFSPFTFALTNSDVVAEVNGNAYKSLKEAIDAAQTGATIVLQKDCTEKVTVAGKSLTINRNGKTFNEANVTVGSNCTKEVKNDTIVVTYTKPSSGGSSGGSSSGKTTYKVTTSAVNNGGVNASPSSAEKGATITITLSPDKGYKLDKLTVTDGSGKTVSTVKKSDTVYTFTMPASAVNVGVSYVKADETPSKTKFNDVSANDWFASAVDYVTGKGMMNGTADNTFSPKANTTRGMVVTVLYRLENQPSTSAASFTDVASGAYYANAVAWANVNGIVSGYGSGKFGPNDKVTREQLAAILYRYAQYKKYDVSVGEDTNILSYDDAQSISSYAIPAIQWACGAGVVTGKSGSKLDPKGNATRAEVAAMLMRFCENVK